MRPETWNLILETLGEYVGKHQASEATPSYKPLPHALNFDTYADFVEELGARAGVKPYSMEPTGAWARFMYRLRQSEVFQPDDMSLEELATHLESGHWPRHFVQKTRS